jgi:hypothetical protein
MDEVKIKAGVDPKLEKLFFMRELTKRTGILHEIQVMNLQSWPMVYTNATKLTCNFSFEDKLVVYDFLKVGPKLTQMADRFLHLEKSVKMLLGDEYSIQVFYKKLQLYPETEHGNKSSKTAGRVNRKRKVAIKKVARKA